jgi:hypothetical protein
MPYSLYRKLGK